MFMNTAAMLLVLAGLTTLAGFATAAKPAPKKKLELRFDNPKEAFKSFCHAIEAHDPAALKRCAITCDKKATALLDSCIRYVIATHRFEWLATQKFGPDRLWRDKVPLWKAGIGETKIMKDGTFAIVDIKEDRQGIKMTLQKEGKDWKVDFLGIDKEELDKASAKAIRLMARYFEEDAAIVTQLTKEIRSGRVTTAEQLRREMGRRFVPRAITLEGDGLIPVVPPAITQPPQRQ